MSVVIGGTSGPSLAGSLEPVAFTGSMSATRPYRNSAGDHLSQNLHHAQGQHPADGNKLAYVAGDMTILVDWDDFNAGESATGIGSAVEGYFENRRIYSLGGVDITDDILTLINEDRGLNSTPISVLPTLFYADGPDVLDANGQMEGQVNAAIGSEVFDSGKYYAVLSGDDADEIVGVLVVTSDIASTTVRETGGFLLYRQ